MNLADLQTRVGTIGRITCGKLEVDVRILDARTAYGRLELLVAPVSGTGRAWVTASRIMLDTQLCAVQ